jgi:hypothetical protein
MLFSYCNTKHIIDLSDFVKIWVLSFFLSGFTGVSLEVERKSLIQIIKR